VTVSSLVLQSLDGEIQTTYPVNEAYGAPDEESQFKSRNSREQLTYVHQMLIQKEELQQGLVRWAPPEAILGEAVQQVIQQAVVETLGLRGCMQLLDREPWSVPCLR